MLQPLGGSSSTSSSGRFEEIRKDGRRGRKKEKSSNPVVIPKRRVLRSFRWKKQPSEISWLIDLTIGDRPPAHARKTIAV